MRDETQFLTEAHRTEAMLRNFCEKNGYYVTPDMRVGESDAAALLGYTHPGSLKNLRAAGLGPPYFERSVGKSKVSYRLSDLSKWIESAREEY
ncbi:hypothetical protein [Pandoraea sputorum]|uniref:hypothetical protein n=1 Tax=Pandoraea sputorum TaxID=93222 RepID=UPI00123F7B6B|nr:hypothetical protein [Pandoraea sputorum]VVE49802.1 hypothetical protein PSP20601_04604 [Pandoraea sputorum]